MNKYLKLLNFELNRFFKIYLVLIVLTVVLQMTAVIVECRQYLKQANEMIYGMNASKEQFLADFGQISFVHVTTDGWFMWSIAICAVTLIIYVFFIWYRDWFARNTFAYRLLTLPTDRINVYLAKATAIFLMVLGLISLQLILFPVEQGIFRAMIPDDFRQDLSTADIITFSKYLTVLFPGTLIEFVARYGAGLMVVLVLFTAILFERCYRFRGIFFGAGYCALAAGIFLSPILIEMFTEKVYLYPIERFFAEVALGLFVSGMSIFISRFLLNYKIRV
ncbi:hypothetical protein [Caldibacillus debilis]|uniref:hypothetical protein n=1 Tax=Caldibacillus debilis TaxID=301148 RepID=UPI000E3B3376|nr:hypothetical protein [Caldibacillus debilis]REJ29675.1 MAG: hypothetical protein C6W56_05380 [Caldibacillus debilis]